MGEGQSKTGMVAQKNREMQRENARDREGDQRNAIESEEKSRKGSSQYTMNVITNKNRTCSLRDTEG